MKVKKKCIAEKENKSNLNKFHKIIGLQFLANILRKDVDKLFVKYFKLIKEECKLAFIKPHFDIK